ncbi:MAG: DUF4266 domain-containing protein [Sandaracinaceae bacterium]
MLRLTTLVFALALGAAALGVGGCAIVPRYQREALAHPAMDATGTLLEDRSLNKLHTARELASGGNGRPAGGGCACSN